MVRANANMESDIVAHVARFNLLQEENKTLKIQAAKVGPLIAENVKLSNRLDNLEDQIEQLNEELSV